MTQSNQSPSAEPSTKAVITRKFGAAGRQWLHTFGPTLEEIAWGPFEGCFVMPHSKAKRRLEVVNKFFYVATIQDVSQR